MLAQYNLGTDYRQSSAQNDVRFADTNGWEYTPGPKEIDIQTYTTNPKTYVNNYVSYLQTELGDTTISGNLIRLTELKGLGCTINDDYSYTDNENCANSSYKSWLVNGQEWWTRSASSTNSNHVGKVDAGGRLDFSRYNFSRDGVRPVITISKEALKNLG